MSDVYTCKLAELPCCAVARNWTNNHANCKTSRQQLDVKRGAWCMQREALIQNKTLLNLICHATWRGLQLSLMRATFRIYPAAARIGTDPAAARRLPSPLLSLALSRSLARPRPVVLRSSARPRVGGIAVRPALPTRQGRGYKYPTE